ncbi:MAG: DNA recombination/repair protein RecA, partial [Clostridia bacterium]|nr:DNA recombination/repair protein RecA [Clostridia bacterium]
FKEAEFDMMYGEGISKVGEIIDLGIKFGFIQKSGAWMSYGDVRVQGRDALKDYFKTNEAEAAKLEKLIREKLQPGERKEEPKAEEKRAAAPKAPASKGAGVEVFADDFEDDDVK